jgi:hypothetical protein
MLIHSFYGTNLPITTKDIEFVEKRNIKVQELKRQLGNKYILSNVTSIHNRGEQHGISKQGNSSR